MRDFICGRETLLHCSGELLGLAVFLLLCVVGLLIWIMNAWDMRQTRKRTPHPNCCCTPIRCDGREQCWMVPSCAASEERRVR